MSEHDAGQNDRLTRLEVQQETNMSSINANAEAIKSLASIVERLTRVEERQQSVARVVYGGGTVIGIVTSGIVVYLVQLVIGA